MVKEAWSSEFIWPCLFFILCQKRYSFGHQIQSNKILCPKRPPFGHKSRQYHTFGSKNTLNRHQTTSVVRIWVRKCLKLALNWLRDASLSGSKFLYLLVERGGFHKLLYSYVHSVPPIVICYGRDVYSLA